MQKSKEQITEEIKREFGDMVFGLPNEKHKTVIPVAHQCLNLGMSLELDEVTTLKFAIIQYHNILSEIMTEKYYEKILQTADINFLVKQIED